MPVEKYHFDLSTKCTIDFTFIKSHTKIYRFFIEFGSNNRFTIIKNNFKINDFHPTINTALFRLNISFKGLNFISSNFDCLKPTNLISFLEYFIVKNLYDVKTNFSSIMNSDFIR